VILRGGMKRRSMATNRIHRGHFGYEIENRDIHGDLECYPQHTTAGSFRGIEVFFLFASSVLCDIEKYRSRRFCDILPNVTL
jgi:hypothetical protein